MTISDNRRTKWASAAEAALPADTQVVELVRGRGPTPVPVPVAVALLAVPIVLLGVLLAYGGVLGGAVGGLVFYSAYVTLLPRRSIAVTDRGLAVLAHSYWSGKPDKLIELVARDAVSLPSAPDVEAMAFGAQTVILRPPERARLARAAGVPGQRKRS